MADDVSRDDGLFGLAAVKQLIAMMARHDLSEIDLKQGEQRVRLRRGPRKMAVAPLGSMPIPQVQPAPPPSAPARVETSLPTPAKSLYEIKSETPGTFYTAPDPNSAPYVRVGSRVKPGDVLCKIEAMKLYNDITTDQGGIISEICVENAQPVEYGQVLFRIDTSA